MVERFTILNGMALGKDQIMAVEAMRTTFQSHTGIDSELMRSA